MNSKLRSLLEHPRQRYILVGVSVYVFELLVILIAEALSARALLAVGLSFWLGLVVSFLLQKLFTFQDKRTHHKVILPQIIASIFLVAFNFSFTLFITHLLISFIPVAICRTLALGVTTIWNYYLYKTHIFKSPEQIQNVKSN